MSIRETLRPHRQKKNRPVIREDATTAVPQLRTIEFAPCAEPDALEAYERLQAAMAVGLMSWTIGPTTYR